MHVERASLARFQLCTRGGHHPLETIRGPWHDPRRSSADAAVWPTQARESEQASTRPPARTPTEFPPHPIRRLQCCRRHHALAPASTVPLVAYRRRCPIRLVGPSHAALVAPLCGHRPPGDPRPPGHGPAASHLSPRRRSSSRHELAPCDGCYRRGGPGPGRVCTYTTSPGDGPARGRPREHAQGPAPPEPSVALARASSAGRRLGRRHSGRQTNATGQGVCRHHSPGRWLLARPSPCRRYKHCSPLRCPRPPGRSALAWSRRATLPSSTHPGSSWVVDKRPPVLYRGRRPRRWTSRGPGTGPPPIPETTPAGCLALLLGWGSLPL